MLTGKVFLVGAGPGDPDLITVKGMKALESAEIVIYDRLANPMLLDYAPSEAERVYAGKEPQRHRLSQDEINCLLVRYAQAGKRVVRLKGGDPFVFGRGGEEAQVLRAAGIPFEVVPGISSALAVPAYVGIPVTQRGLSPSFTVVTGHTCNADDPTGVEWDALPGIGTLVILMGVRYLATITRNLIATGRNPNTPTAIIERGTTPQQRTVTGTLSTIADLAKAADVQPPAITVVGEVVALCDEIGRLETHALGE